MSMLSIILYYFVYPHPEERSFFLIYLAIVWVFFGIYKWFQGMLFQRVELRISHLIYFFFAHLCILCLGFFAVSWWDLFSGFALFLKISFFLTCLSILWGVMYALWRTIIERSKIFHFHNDAAKHLASLGLGFGVYIMWVFACAYFWYYTLPVVSWWTAVCAIVSYKICFELWKSRNVVVQSYDISSKHSSGGLSLLIDELHFWVVTFLLSINFISVYRPFPIGWDDLGAYMNYPKLLSQSGELIAVWKMYLFELYTGLGFLLWSQTYAFYLSSFTWVITSIIIYIGLRNLFQKIETPFDFSLLCVMILLMMPMSVFQLAKDMKLDFGLLGISAIALFLMYDVLLWNKHFSHKKFLWTLALLGFIVGIAFSIKVTSLLLLLGILGMLFYKKFALSGLLWFFAIFSWVFTQFNLWKLMNVIVPGEWGIWTSIFSIGLILLWVFLLLQSYYKKSAGIFSWVNIIIETLCIFTGFIIALSPWIMKHIGEIPEWKNITLGTLISGYGESYYADYASLYSAEELVVRQESSRIGIQEDGTTSNEDFWRYFGSELWINNYLKLPYNLSFQLNQSGEFTDMSFIFFALIPALFLFLPYRKPEYIFPVITFLWLLLLYYIPNPAWDFMSRIFSSIDLPGWYIAIFTFIFSPLIYLYNTLERNNKWVEIFLLTLAFSSIYVFLWAISAFWVVWYGIVMYLSFLILIASVFLSFEKKSGGNEYVRSEKNILSYFVLSIIWIYVIISVIPHGVRNLKNAGYWEYKRGLETEQAAIFERHPEYFPMLMHLNIQKKFHENLIRQYAAWQKQEVFETIITPLEEMKNRENIYRVGTFLKYYITDNTQRLLEDSLLVQFENFIYDANRKLSLERLQKLNISYLLIDLNAATIDDAEWEQLLTQRYMHLLDFISLDDMELIETDSICLKIWLTKYSQNQDRKEFLDIAGINYGDKNEKIRKAHTCLTAFVQEVLEGKEGYLNPYREKLISEDIDTTDLKKVAQTLAAYLKPGSKALFEISK